MGKTHMVAGSVAWLAGAQPIADVVGIGELSPAAQIGGFVIATAAGLLPDIDHPDALLSRGWVPFRKFLGPLGKPIGFLFSIPPRLIGMLSRTVMGHRGGTHSLLFLALWTLLALPIYAGFAFVVMWLLSLVLQATPLAFSPAAVADWAQGPLLDAMPVVMLAVALGYLSHLVVDSLNTVPVPWLWPAKRRFFFLPKGLRIRVSSPAEWLFRSIITVCAVALFVINIGVPAFEQARDAAGDIAGKAQTQVEKAVPAGSRGGR